MIARFFDWYFHDMLELDARGAALFSLTWALAFFLLLTIWW